MASHDLSSLVAQSLAESSFIQLTLSRPTAAAAAIRKVTAKLIEIKAGPRVQFTFAEATRETHRNATFDEASAEVRALFETSFQEANLFLATADVTFKRRNDGSLDVASRKPSKPAALPVLHNRGKQYLIPDGVPCPFLIEIGVMTREGQVRAAKYDKFRQVNRFLELVNDVLPELPQDGVLRVVDFGCGKSYLTFALHHLLTVIHQRDVEIVGLDLKRDVMSHCESVARKLDCRGLTFRVGDIAAHETSDPVHLTVSLHACDVATDAALLKAIGWGTQVILAVPCCQHEFASKMSRELLPPLQRHGILRERFASLATDAYRALLLERNGYRTQVIEFIDMEHTPKNLMLRAIRQPLSSQRAAELDVEIAAFRKSLGLQNATLALGTQSVR